MLAENILRCSIYQLLYYDTYIPCYINNLDYFWSDIVYVSFSKPTYSQYEDEGVVCPTLVLNKPALTDMMIQITDKTHTATGKSSTIIKYQ